MDYRRLFLFLVSVILCGGAMSQTTLKGVVKNTDTGSVGLYVFDDFITNTLVKVDECEIAKDGSFELQTDFSDVRYAKLETGPYSAGIYLEPDVFYYLDVEYDAVDSFLNPNLLDTPLYYTIRNEVFDGLNTKIASFNAMYDDFVINNSATLFRDRTGKLLRKFKEDVELRFEGYENNYFDTYKRYRIAGIELQTRALSRAELHMQYLSGRPLYHHDEAMSYFNLYYDGYPETSGFVVSRNDLQYVINGLGSYPALLDTLGKDTLLRNEAMRELVMIKLLKSCLFSMDYDYEQVLGILQYIADSSKFKQHRHIAGNILSQELRLTWGASAPEKAINEESFLHESDKYTLLCFFQSWNGACQAENELIKTLQEQYSDHMDVTMVCCDTSEDTWKEWYEQNRATFRNAYWCANDRNLTDAYNVKAFPLYVIFTPDLKIIRWDLKRPSEGMDAFLERLFAE